MQSKIILIETSYLQILKILCYTSNSMMNKTTPFSLNHITVTTKLVSPEPVGDHIVRSPTRAAEIL